MYPMNKHQHHILLKSKPLFHSMSDHCCTVGSLNEWSSTHSLKETCLFHTSTLKYKKKFSNGIAANDTDTDVDLPVSASFWCS